MLILPTGCFMQLYYNPDAQGRYASQFPSGSQGFLQPRGDIRESIVPRGFRALPDDIQEVVDAYFHREELEDKAGRDVDDDQEMSTDTEVAVTVRRLKVSDPMATASLQRAIRDMLTPATAPRPQDLEEFYYDSDESVLDLDEEYPGLGECIIKWQAARWGTASLPGWHPLNFGQLERSCYEKEPNLWEILNQARQARAVGNVPVQKVAPMPLPVTSVRDWDHQRQQCFDQTVAKRQSSLLDEEQCKRARTPPQADPKDAPIWDHAQHEGHENHDQGHSRTRDNLDRQLELDRAHSRVHTKSHRRSKSRKCSKSRKHSKSGRRSKSKGHGGHEVHKPGVWSSQQARSPSRGCPEEDRPCQPPSTSSHSYEQNRNAGHAAHPMPSKDEMSQFLKLKEEVTKQPQGYIQRCAKHITHSLTPDHEVVKCLVAFGENALKYAMEVLATIEWVPNTGNCRSPSRCLTC